MPVTPAPPKQRLLFIDTLRGFSAFSVVLYHMIYLADPVLHPPVLFGFFLEGGLGVEMFFIISGYSLCMTMPRHIQSGKLLFSFFTHRACRILPLFYFILLVSIFFASKKGVPLDTRALLANITCTYNIFPGYQESLVMAGWTIGAEILFYVLFPTLYKYFNTGYRIGGIFLAALLFSGLFKIVVSASYYNLSILKHMPIFIGGMLLYHIGKSMHIPNKLKLVLSILFCAIAVFLYQSIGNWQILHEIKYYSMLVPFSLIFLGLMLFPLPALVSPATAFLGKISFSMYLIHPLVIVSVRHTYPKIEALNLGPTMSFSLCAALTLGIVISLSSLIFLYVEAPGIWLGKWLVGHCTGAARKP